MALFKCNTGIWIRNSPLDSRRLQLLSNSAVLSSPLGLLWFLSFMYSRCSLPSFWRCSYLSQHGLFLFSVWIMSALSVGDRSVFPLTPKWHPAPSTPPLASHPQPLSYFLLSRVLLPSSHWWNWPSCYDSPAPFLFDIWGQLCLFFYVLWRCKRTHTHTNTRSLSHPTLIISLVFPFKKCSESCNALTLKHRLLSL